MLYFLFLKEPTPAPVSPPAEKVSTKGKNIYFSLRNCFLNPSTLAKNICKSLQALVSYTVICAYSNTFFMTFSY